MSLLVFKTFLMIFLPLNDSILFRCVYQVCLRLGRKIMCMSTFYGQQFMYYINGNVFQRIVHRDFTKYYSSIRTILSEHKIEARNTLAVQRKIEHMFASSFGTS